MVRKAFPDKEIKILKKGIAEKYPGEDPSWRIRVVEFEKPRRRIVLCPTEELMMDEGIPFIDIFEEGIKYAKQRLSLVQEGFLGNVILETTGITFESKGI